MNVVKVVVVWLLLMSSNAMGCTNPYTVRGGDNLWNLAALKLNDPLKWVELENKNPILRDRTRYFKNDSGQEVVRIIPGEILCGFDRWDWIVNDFQDPSSNEMPDSSNQEQVRELPNALEAQVKFDSNDQGLQWLVILLVAIIFLSICLEAWKGYRQRRKLVAEQVLFRAVNTDPATAGPPMVSGGVTEVNVEQALRNVAARSFGGTRQDFTVLERVVGRVYGTMMVSYRDNTERQWVMSGQQAYQARVRRTNGHVEVIYMLQQCGNDLRFGEVAGYQPSEDFRFEPEAVPSVVEAPAAAPVVTEVATPVPVSVPVESVVAPLVQAPVVEVPVAVPVEPQRVAAEPTPRGTIRVEVKPADGNGPNLVQVTGISPVGASIKVSPTGFELRYVELAPENK